MELLVGDALILALGIALVRWASRRPQRFAALVCGATCATAFVVVFLRYDLEDRQYLTALGVACGAALLLAFTSGLAAREGARRAAAYAGLAGGLVAAVPVAYIPVSLTACLLTGCDLS